MGWDVTSIRWDGKRDGIQYLVPFHYHPSTIKFAELHVEPCFVVLAGSERRMGVRLAGLKAIASRHPSTAAHDLENQRRERFFLVRTLCKGVTRAGLPLVLFCID